MRILSAMILYTIAPFVFGSPMWARAGIPWIDISDTSYSPGLSITSLASLVCEFCWDEKSAISSDLVTDFKPRSDRLSSTVKLAVLVTSFIQFAPKYCIKLVTKTESLTVDDNLSDLGLKSVTKSEDIALFSSQQNSHASDARLAIDSSGEYEVSDISIQGIPARAHMGEPKTNGAIVYKIIADNMRIGVLGHIDPDLSDAQLESLGTVD